jgi:hypothetical protein
VNAAIEKAPADPMCAERILVALGVLREGSAVDVCRALGVDPLGDDYAVVCRRLANMHAFGLANRYRKAYARDRLYSLTAAGCELAMIVQPSGEAPAEVAA